MTSPNHVISRLVHGDNLKNWPVEEQKLVEEKIINHVYKCKFNKCVIAKYMFQYDSYPILETIKNALS